MFLRELAKWHTLEIASDSKSETKSDSASTVFDAHRHVLIAPASGVTRRVGGNGTDSHARRRYRHRRRRSLGGWPVMPDIDVKVLHLGRTLLLRAWGARKINRIKSSSTGSLVQSPDGPLLRARPRRIFQIAIFLAHRTLRNAALRPVRLLCANLVVRQYGKNVRYSRMRYLAIIISKCIKIKCRTWNILNLSMLGGC